jgi:hypothetical protein
VPATTRRLLPHPSTPCDAVEVSAEIERVGDRLVVRYMIVGALDGLRIPAAPLDRERLWAHTCCELFVAPAQSERYVEWNFSPSGQIARFAFSGYRQRIPAATESGASSVVARQGRELRIDASVPLPPELGDTIRVSITAVIEDVAGALSYWALAHPSERPDFHHDGGFVLIVDR